VALRWFGGNRHGYRLVTRDDAHRLMLSSSEAPRKSKKSWRVTRYAPPDWNAAPLTRTAASPGLTGARLGPLPENPSFDAVLPRGPVGGSTSPRAGRTPFNAMRHEQT
jgi:hypothetical protein